MCARALTRRSLLKGAAAGTASALLPRASAAQGTLAANLVGGTNPGATAWTDDTNDYQVNEVAINWVAAFVYATAALTPAP